MEKVKLIASLILIAFVSCREQKSEAVTKVDSAFVGYTAPFDSVNYYRDTINSVAVIMAKQGLSRDSLYSYMSVTDLTKKPFVSWKVINRTKGSLSISIDNGDLASTIFSGAARTKNGKVVIIPTPDFDGIIYLTIKP